MKRFIFLVIVSVSCLGCDYDGLKSIGPIDPDPYPDPPQSTRISYGAYILLTDSITGLTIKDSVRIYSSDSTHYTIYNPGQITIYGAAYTVTPWAPAPSIVRYRAFVMEGYEMTGWILIEFHYYDSEYQTYRIKLKPI